MGARMNRASYLVKYKGRTYASYDYPDSSYTERKTRTFTNKKKALEFAQRNNGKVFEQKQIYPGE